MYYHSTRAEITFKVVRLVLRQARRMARLLLRRPIVDVLFIMLVLYVLATLIGSVNRPQPLLYPTPPAVFEGR